MAKKTILFLILILILPLCSAEDMWFYNSNYLVLDIDLSTGFDIVSQSPNPNIDFITANVSFFPKKMPGQEILTSNFNPIPQFSDDTAVFEWKSPPKTKLLIDMDSKVRIRNNPPKIMNKIIFPLKNLPDDIAVYTQPAEIIDLNDDIITIASDIASGKDDVVDVVDGIAVWVNTNIRYNLSTVTAEAAQKSTWVLKNREGVCDELTSLFISMVRSLGIPARFVAGISYTNAPGFANNWGPHGWAEVYFPGYGWVPYDVTYGEYGWVDPTHIITKVSNDAGKISSNYMWRAESGVSLNIEDLKTKVTVVDVGGKNSPDVSLSVREYRNDVGFGSYNLITASIANLKDYYVSEDVYISRTTKIKIVDDGKKHVLLRPGEIKEIQWILGVDDGLDDDYIYTFPVEVFTLDNITAKTEFSSVKDAEVYSLDEIKELSALMQQENGNVYSKNLDVECSMEKKEYYDYEKPILQCSLKNKGNIFLKNLRVCLEDDCDEHNIGITQEKGINFTVRRISKGDNNLTLRIENEQISRTKDIMFKGLDEPKISIADVEFPSSVRYNDEFSVQFRLKKESYSEPQNVVLRLSGAGVDLEYKYDIFSEDSTYKINIIGKYLNEGENNIKIDLAYRDKNGKEYSESEEMNMSLTDITFFQKIMLYFMEMFR